MPNDDSLATAAACDHTDHRVNDRGERQGQIARTAWESCATAATVLTVRVERDTVDGGFVVSADEAPGCMSQGDTITAALENFTDAFTEWAIARAASAMAVPT